MSNPSLRDLAEPPRLSADARLPNPSILTCNEPIPLRLLVKKMSETSESIFLQMLQVELIAYTNILAHDLSRTESGSWVILSRSNMGMAVGRGTDPVGTEWTIDPSLWNHTPLPNSVAPSFETCNISRSYELEIRIGLSRGNVSTLRVSPPLSPSTNTNSQAPTHRPPIENAGQGLFRNSATPSPAGRHGRVRPSEATTQRTGPRTQRTTPDATPARESARPSHRRRTGRRTAQLRGCNGRNTRACGWTPPRV